MLAAWGRFVHRHRWIVLILSLSTSALSLWLTRYGGRLDSAFAPAGTEAARAVDLMERELPRRPLAFELIFGHPTMRATDPVFRAAVDRAVAPLREDSRVSAVRTAWDGPRPDPDRWSRDGRHTRVTVELGRDATAV